MKKVSFIIILLFLFLYDIVPTLADRLAILNWETKAPESLDSLSLSQDKDRKEGIAVIELDQNSEDFGKILFNIPVNPDLVLHHIFYNQNLSKAYITALDSDFLHVINMSDQVWRLKPIHTPMCKVQENIIFSDDNTKWWLTCMGSENVIVGDAISDQIIDVISLPNTFPHGITLDERIDRILVANCVAPDMSNAGKTIEVIEASTGKHLDSIEISRGSLNAPVEVLFVPNSDPPVAYATTMMENSLWGLKWNYESNSFEAKELFDFVKADKSLMPLEIYFNKDLTLSYITTADPGRLHVFDVSQDLMSPILIRSIDAGGGAHHVAITKDEKTAYVQNGLLNIPGINDGSITVIDLEKLEVINVIETFKSKGRVPNSITLLPKWYNSAGHINNGNK